LNKLDYSNPIKIEKGIYWIGYLDRDFSLHCNPYIIIEGDEAVVIDGGSRTDFSTVMMKILQTGINPKNITHLIYHHYDPDLCGSIPDFEEIINNENLKILSHSTNNVFIKYYGGRTKRECISTLNYEYTFKTGRKLKFFMTPYSHSQGSFITYDEQTKTLFTSDIFGSYGKRWELYLELTKHCDKCTSYTNCPLGKKECDIEGILEFHRKIMTSKIALDYALDIIAKLDVNIIAPQHGSIINDRNIINTIIKKLKEEKNIGIDRILNGERL
jgi:flavorubredoxin